MSRYMITHSLLSSWLYAMKENPYEDMETERDPIAEFKTVLERTPTPTTEAMLKGINFENFINATVTHSGSFENCKLNEDGSVSSEFLPLNSYKNYDAGYSAAAKIYGSQLQFKANKTVQIAGKNIFLYGRLDALKAGVIYDIKYASKYERGKFFTSTQHPMYFELIPEANEFTYVISDGNDVWTETYRREETRSIIPIIEDFLSWLDVMGMMKIFEEHWEAL